MWSTRYSCQILIKPNFSRQIFDKYVNIKHNENPSIGSQVVSCGRTDIDMTILIAVFRNSANASKNGLAGKLIKKTCQCNVHVLLYNTPRSRLWQYNKSRAYFNRRYVSRYLLRERGLCRQQFDCIILDLPYYTKIILLSWRMVLKEFFYLLSEIIMLLETK
jgi:hypothetical protein